jgi:mRNA interferase RelE/StbE
VEPYLVQFLDEAVDDLRRLDAAVNARILKRLEWLRENFDAITPEALTGSLAGLCKLRVGDYRVIYQADRARRIIVVHATGHRREIYRQK